MTHSTLARLISVLFFAGVIICFAQLSDQSMSAASHESLQPEQSSVQR